MFTSSFLYFFLAFTLSSACDSNLPAGVIEELYDKSYQVVTGFLSSKYQSATTFQPGEQNMLEFEVTEIQKGPRRQKIMTYIENADSLNVGYEYLIFIDRNKKSSTNKVIAVYRVCYKCDNAEIREVYSIVRKRFLRRIKPPLPKYTMGDGCGC